MKKKEVKKILMFLIPIFAIISILLIAMVSAGWFEDFKIKMTGKYSQNVALNISVGGPQIVIVDNNTITNFITGPTEDSSGSIIVNFTAYSPSGAGNLNDSTARINVTFDTTRGNTTCYNYQSSGNYANYTCNVTMYWWDGSGSWNITAHILDNQSNSAMNTSTNFYVGLTTTFVLSPNILEWSSLSPGSTNQTATVPLVLNNTGNDVITTPDLEINSTNLRGETTPTQALWAGNFSVDWDGIGTNECDGTIMTNNTFTGIVDANLSKGNYTLNDGDTGQEELYFCILTVGSELSTQAYSTANETEGNWMVQIT